MDVKCECSGENKGKVFDYDDKKCKKTCNDNVMCINGGTCNPTDVGGYCVCKQGTEGDLCEIVTECINKDCGNEATCVYDHELEKGVCRCNNIELSLDPSNNKCKKTCNDTVLCINGGTCNPTDVGAYCVCKQGTEGDFCEIVTECNNKDCGNEATCVYDHELETGVCRCNDAELSLDPSNNKCKKPCNAIDDCKNGAECAIYDGRNYCKCKPGTEGGICEKVPECLEMDCGSDAKCGYDVGLEKAVCQCKDRTLSFDPKSKSCKTGSCASNPCKNGGICIPEKDSYRCECPLRYKGPNCDEAVCLEEEKNVCGDVLCVYDRLLGKGTCNCSEGEEFDHKERACKDVDACLMKMLRNECNKPHETCIDGKCSCENNYIYTEGNKSCKENFCAYPGVCPANSKCSELGSGNVLCVCEKGFVQREDACEKIDFCSPGQSECEQLCDSDNKKCGCEEGFTLRTDRKTCEATTKQEVCALNCGKGKCVKKDSEKPRCICPLVTHIFNGTTCIDKCTYNNFTAPAGMCLSNKCELNGKYVFRCKCDDPYELHEDGIHCKRKAMCKDKKVKETCNRISALCQETLTGKGYECVCDKGFDKEDGICVDKCDMKEQKKKCDDQRATCELDSTYNAVCRCPPLLKIGEEGVCDTLEENSYTGKLSILKSKYELRDAKRRFRRSTENINDILLRKDMTESIHETYDNNTDVKILQCNVSGTLVSCEVELQLSDESKSKVNIISSPAVCLPLDDEHCLLKPNLIMRRMEEEEVFQETDPCETTIQKKLCGNLTLCTGKRDAFECSCKKGYYPTHKYFPRKPLNTTLIEQCADICTKVEIANECETQNKTCVRNETSDRGYNCVCRKGDKEVNGKCIDVCDQQQNKAKCKGQGKVCLRDENAENGFKCVCQNDKMEDKNGKCIDNPCVQNPCQNGGTCSVINETFSCTCKDRFSGKYCHLKGCLKEEEDKCGSADCVYDSLLDEVACVCGGGREFISHNSSCAVADLCLKKLLNNECNKPHQTCKNGECECEENYKHNNETNSCEENFCQKNNECPLGFDCTELGSGNVLCSCKKGYVQKGWTCRGMNKCTPGLSQCKQSCNEETGDCECYPGFSKDADEKCKPDSEQASDCDLKCGAGTCVKTDSGKECVCPTVTHVSNGTNCIDKCTANDFRAPENMCPSGECELSDKHVFRCKCKNQFELDADGIHCKRKAMCQDANVIEECSKQSAICRETLTGVGYRCECDKGYERGENNKCVRKCDIKANQKKCGPLKAKCKLDSNYDVTCTCPPLLMKGTNGVCDKLAKYSYTGELSIAKYKYITRDAKRRSRRSTDEIDMIMLEQDVQNAIKKTYEKTANNGASVQIVHCRVGESEVTCTLELQLKVGSVTDANRIFSKSICLPLDDENCVVKPNFILRKTKEESVVFNQTKACENEDIKDKLCGNATTCVPGEKYGDFHCTCNRGFSVINAFHPIPEMQNTFIQTCNDINECLNASACPPTTKCENSYGSYDCKCKDGHKKKSPSSDPKKEGCLAYCDPNPCHHGTCVVVDEHGFSCNCTEGYTGILCNTTVSTRVEKPQSKKPAIIGGVLGGILILVLIIGVVVYTRMKQKKNDDEEYARSRQKGILAEMNRMRKEQPRFEEDRDARQGRRDSGEYRRAYSDERIIPRIQTPRSDSEMPGRSRTSREEARSGSKVYYKNRGYDEEEE